MAHELKPVLTAFRCVRARWVRPTWGQYMEELNRQLTGYTLPPAMLQLVVQQALDLYRPAYGWASTPDEKEPPCPLTT